MKWILLVIVLFALTAALVFYGSQRSRWSRYRKLIDRRNKRTNESFELVTKVPQQTTGRWKPRPTPPPYQLPEEYAHVVFIGDSLTRYQYLDIVYREHFGVSEVPDIVTCEKFHPSWNEFYNFSTAIFGGNMSCDCYRDAVFSVENRYYRHPSKNLILSYFQFFADFIPFQFFHGPEFLPEAKPMRVPPAVQRYSLLQGVDYLSRLSPKPTHIVLNFGIWPHVGPKKELHKFLWRARSITPHIVWKGTSPLASEVSPVSSPNKIEAFNSGRLTGGFGDGLANMLCSKGLCTFFPFPVESVCQPSYWDNHHFFPTVYTHWSSSLFKVLAATYERVDGASSWFKNTEKLFNVSDEPCKGGRRPGPSIPVQRYFGNPAHAPKNKAYIPTRDPLQWHALIVGNAEMFTLFSDLCRALTVANETTRTGDAASEPPANSSSSHPPLLLDVPSLQKTVALSTFKRSGTAAQGMGSLLSYIPMNEAVDFEYAVVPALREMDPPASTVVLHKAPFMKCDSKLEELIGTVYEWTTIRAPHGSVLWLQSNSSDDCDALRSLANDQIVEKVVESYSSSEDKPIRALLAKLNL